MNIHFIYAYASNDQVILERKKYGKSLGRVNTYNPSNFK